MERQECGTVFEREEGFSDFATAFHEGVLWFPAEKEKGVFQRNKFEEVKAMERQQINDMDIENVVGGSIVFNGAHTTCGRNCNNQYNVLDYSKVLQYIAANYKTMSEKKMLANMLAAGLLSEITEHE